MSSDIFNPNAFNASAFQSKYFGDVETAPFPPFVDPTWTPVNKPSGTSPHRTWIVVSNGSTIVATTTLANQGLVAANPADKFYSTDAGASWGVCTQPARGSMYSPAIVFHNNTWFSWDYVNSIDYLRKLQTSVDGVTWVSSPIAPNTFDGEVSNGVVSNGEYILCFGVNQDYWYNDIYKSFDGFSWTLVSSIPDPQTTDIYYANSLLWITDFNLWLLQVTPHGEDYYPNGPSKLFTSPDAVTWTEVSRAGMPADMHDLSGAWGGIVVPSGFPTIITAYAQDDGVGGTERVFASYDLINWTKVWDGGDIFGASTVCYFEGGVIVFSGGRLLISPDGFNWQQYSIPAIQSQLGTSQINSIILASRTDGATPGFYITDIEVDA